MDIPSYLLGKKAGGGGGGANLQTKEVTITENGTTAISPDIGYDGMSEVDVTVNGILDTSDANATASDIAQGKSGYVNGIKVNGNVPVGSPVVATNYASSDVSLYLDDLKVDTEQRITNQFFNTGDKISVLAPLTDVAPVIGATAEKIKKDEVICGVTGTYEGTGGDLDEYFKNTLSQNDARSLIKKIPGPITPGSTLAQTFSAFYSLTDAPLMNTQNVQSMNATFSNCRELQNVPLYNTSAVTNMASMFSFCYKLQTIPQFNTSAVTNMNGMFNGCTILESVPLLNTSSVLTMNNMFYNCGELITIPQFDTSSVTDMSSMFSNCRKLQTVPQFDTSSVTNMGSMFNSCTSLTDSSLENILAMCINATSYTGTKKLQTLGIRTTNYSLSRLQALSNYQDFIDAGWTIQ